MLRIHFTTDDLAATKIAPGPDPLWELSLSIHQLRLRESNVMLGPWKRRTAYDLRLGGQARARVELLLGLSPPRGYFPDFLTPFEGAAGFGAGLDAVLATSRTRLRTEMGLFATAHPALAATTEAIGRGGSRALAELGTAMTVYHDVAIAPVWEALSAAVLADRAHRGRQLLDSGWGAVLSGLHPSATFADNILNIGVWGMAGDGDIYLDGRGLLLIPSYFKEQRQLMVLADTDLPPVLVYPVDPYARVAVDTAGTSLAALIGHTRAMVLTAAVAGGSTSQIARRLRLSVPAASKHLTTLRNSGLVTSVRDHAAMAHQLTPLGAALLAAGR